MEKCIVVDWGTTSLRVMLVLGGDIAERKESKKGVQFVLDGQFEAVLMDAIAPWLARYGNIPIVALGMVTSKNGWVEVPYVTCPASIRDLADGAVHLKLANGSDVFFLAGLTDKERGPFPDVMRGEETQVVGLGLDQVASIVLPGTHSKWVKVGGGDIRRFQTFVTGEIFALLSEHSFIAKACDIGVAAVDWAAFDRGAEVGRSCSKADAPFLSQLFSVRTGLLAGEIAPCDTIGFLSGLVISNEFRQAQESGWFTDGDLIWIVGNNKLSIRYGRVAKIFGLCVEAQSEKATLKGARQIFDTITTGSA